MLGPRVCSLIVAIATSLLACSDDVASHDAEAVDAGRLDAAIDASSGGARHAGSDAAADSGRMLHECPNGGWIPSKSQCLQDNAYCHALPDDAGWCTGNVAPQCPPGSSPLEPMQPCPTGRTCFQYSERLHCMVGFHADASIVDDTGRPAPLEISVAGLDADISAELGQELDLLLGTVGPGRYGDPMLTSTGVQFLGVDEPDIGGPAGPVQVFRFRCFAAGTSVIRIPHSEHDAFRLVLHCE